MVTTSETTQIITQPKIEESVEPSLKRWFKHLCYLPASSRYFSKQDKQIEVSLQVKMKFYLFQIKNVKELKFNKILIIITRKL